MSSIFDNIDKELYYDLMSRINIMKPATIDPDNTKEVLKLETILDSDDYGAEEKYDGCNYFMAGCLFISKDHVDKTDNFPHLRDFFMKLGMTNLILDCEIWYPGKTSQYCTRVTGCNPENAVAFQQSNGPIHCVILDMIRTPKGSWLIKEPWENRVKLRKYFYEEYIKGTEMEHYIHLPELRYRNKKQFRDEVFARNGEGIVVKKLNSLYTMGKKPKWIWMKIKQSDETDLIITGFEKPKKLYTGKNLDGWEYWDYDDNGNKIPVTKYYANNWIGALQLSAYVSGKLTKIATCSGFDEGLRAMISQDPSRYLNKVVKVGYMEKTEAGYPRHPRFIDMHPDKRPDECTYELTPEI